MKLRLSTAFLSIAAGLLTPSLSKAQVTLLHDYVNNKSAAIGTFQSIDFREAGFSGLYPIANTNGKEFWTVSDRGVNVDCANANPAECRPTYDKMYAFPSYAPKIHRIRVNGDSIQILQSISIKRPNGTTATGLLNPAGFGSTEAELNSTDTVLACTNFAAKTVAKDIWGIDSEGIVVDKEGNFWICEEGGPTIWKLNRNGVVVKRFTPYANLPGAQPEDVAIDTVFKYRKNNRGFEGISITPNGKIYAIIQSPILYPTTAAGDASRIHRILEIDPETNATRMFAYVNEGVIGSGANQVRLKDWKIGDMAAINSNEFLIIEVGIRGTSDSKKVYKIDISEATPVTSELYNGKTLEELVDGDGLAANGIVPVRRTIFLDLVANGWPASLDKAEGLAIVNDSTVVLCNDNDYGQTSLNADGIATATGNLSHMFVFGLKGANKISNYVPFLPALAEGTTGISTSTTPYLVPVTPGVKLTSILTTNDVVDGYKMCGIPDGLGAFDNNDGTFTLLMNHEFGNTAGVTRAHGSKGAFVSKWVIQKSDLSVISGSDLIQNVNLWNGTGYTTYNSSSPSSSAAFARFCSADLPVVSAFYNAQTGMGTHARIFMNGEESGNEGRVFAHIASGAAAGTSYELPALGKASWENLTARPVEGDKTVVVGMDDSTPGQVYVYIGNKTESGSDVEKAGLTNGKLYGVSVTGMLNETNTNLPVAGTGFTLVDLGDVKNSTGAEINTNSNNLGVSNFLRPEDGAWDPSNLNDFYFVTTNAFASPSRLWRLRFSDINNPETGGTIEAVLDGTEGQKMLDNLAIDQYGHILLVEDVGGNAHIGRVLQYDIDTDVLTTVAEHDRTRFLNGGANFLTQDEEATGILDMQEILGPGMFLTADQAHYSIPGEVVEGGQLLALFNPDSYNSNPEISVTADNNFGTTTTGKTITQNVIISNAGPGALKIKAINFSGTDFALEESLIFPVSIAAGESQTLGVTFAPLADGLYETIMTIENNDFDESRVEVALTGLSTSLGDVTGIFPSGSLSATGIQIFPNPAGDFATVAITMEKAEHVTISVFNSKGALVTPVIEKELAAGKNEVALSTSALQNGIYVVKLSSASGTKSVKAVVTH